MFGRYQSQSFYQTTLVYDVPAISSGSPLDVFQLQVAVAPKYNQGWIILNPDQSGEEDLIFFHARTGSTLFYYRKDRDLLNNGMKNKRIRQSTPVKMKDIAEWYNWISKNTSDFGFVEPWNLTNSFMVRGGRVQFGEQNVLVADIEVVVPSFPYAIVFDYVDNTFKGIPVSSLSTLKGVHVATVTSPTALIDQRSHLLHSEYSDTFFDFVNGELVIKNDSIGTAQLIDGSVTTVKLSNGSVTTAKLADDSVTSPKIAPNPNIRGYVELDNQLLPSTPSAGRIRFYTRFVGGQQRMYYLDDQGVEREFLVGPLVMPPPGEVNTGSNVGFGNQVFQGKVGVDLRFRTLVAGPHIIMTQTGDEIQIEVDPTLLSGGGGGGGGGGGCPTVETFEMFFESFLGNGSQSSFPLNNLPFGAGYVRVYNDDGDLWINLVDRQLVGQNIVFGPGSIPGNGEVFYVEYYSRVGFSGGFGGYLDAYKYTRDDFLGNGIITNFVLSFPLLANTIPLVYNDDGIVYVLGVDYTVLGTSLNFTNSLGDGERVYIHYYADTAFIPPISCSDTNALQLRTTSYLGDGVQTSFTLSGTPVFDDAVEVWTDDGVMLVQGVDYGIVGNLIIFVNPAIETYYVRYHVYSCVDTDCGGGPVDCCVINRISIANSLLYG